MAEYQKNKNPKNSTYSKVTIFVLSFFSIILIVGLFRIIPKERATKENTKQVLEVLGTLQNQSTSLAYQIDSLRTQDGIEEQIREKFRVVKEGEGLVVIVDEKRDKNETQSVVKTGNFWGFLKGIFN